MISWTPPWTTSAPVARKAWSTWREQLRVDLVLGVEDADDVAAAVRQGGVEGLRLVLRLVVVDDHPDAVGALGRAGRRPRRSPDRRARRSTMISKPRVRWAQQPVERAARAPPPRAGPGRAARSVAGAVPVRSSKRVAASVSGVRQACSIHQTVALAIPNRISDASAIAIESSVVMPRSPSRGRCRASGS